jgi:zinc finger FYVE domain-containing protein 26
MAKNASTMQDDSLSTDAYLNVLYMPSFTKSERSRTTSEDPLDNFATISAQGGEEGARSNLDRSRYEECIFYLQEVCFLFFQSVFFFCFTRSFSGYHFLFHLS